MSSTNKPLPMSKTANRALAQRLAEKFATDVNDFYVELTPEQEAYRKQLLEGDDEEVASSLFRETQGTQKRVMRPVKENDSLPNILNRRRRQPL